MKWRSLILVLFLVSLPVVMAQGEKGKELFLKLDELIKGAKKLAESGENPTKMLKECYAVMDKLKEAGYDVSYYEKEIYEIKKIYAENLISKLEKLLEDAKMKAKAGENPELILDECWSIIDKLKELGYDTTGYEKNIEEIKEIYAENSATPIQTVTVTQAPTTTTGTVTPATTTPPITVTTPTLEKFTIDVEPKTVKAKGGETIKFKIKINWKPENWRGHVKFKIILSAGGFSKTFELPELDLSANPPIVEEIPVTLPKNLPPMTYNVKIVATADGKTAESNVNLVYQTPGFEIALGAVAILSTLYLRRKFQ